MSIYYSFSSGRQQIGAAVGHDTPFGVARDQEVVVESRIPDSEMRTVAFSGSAETIELVAAVASRVIELNSYTLVCDTDTTIQFKSGTNYISGPMDVAANGGISTSEGVIMITGSGEALNLSNSAGNIGGHITYKVI